uniref:Retrotransposon protein n=1 Tax=Cucumis melo TaxID=3656 RepID=A0A9I9DTW1_CUCME
MCYVFGKDRRRCGVECVEGYNGFPTNDGNDMEIPMMYSWGLNMSPDDTMGTHGRSSEGRNGSIGSRRKQGGQTVETVKIICNAMEYANDQLKDIAEWPNL